MPMPTLSRPLPWRRAALFLWPALLAACGGGGSDTSDASASQAISPAPGASAPAATCGLADFQAAAMARINQKRAQGATCGARGVFAPTTPLAWSSKLTEASAAHSGDMSAQNYFNHTSLDGRTLSNRIDATGYQWSTIGENIAAGYSTVNIVVDAWIASEGHCANLMSPNFTEVGLACVPGTASTTYNNYWTMDLARPL